MTMQIAYNSPWWDSSYLRVFIICEYLRHLRIGLPSTVPIDAAIADKVQYRYENS